MRGLIWNCRGVGKKGMATCLSDLISDHSIDFLGLQETLKKDFSPKIIRRFDPFGNFHWEWVPVVGRSGGILCGIRTNTLEVLGCTKGRYLLQLNIKDFKTKKAWILFVVYGSAHEEHRDDFLRELASFCNSTDLPYIVDEDFNILRHS